MQRAGWGVAMQRIGGVATAIATLRQHAHFRTERPTVRTLDRIIIVVLKYPPRHFVMHTLLSGRDNSPIPTYSRFGGYEEEILIFMQMQIIQIHLHSNAEDKKKSF